MNPLRSALTFPAIVVYQLVDRRLVKNIGGRAPYFIALFISIISLNLLGLTPYTFALTRHISFNLAIAFPLWLAVVLIGFSYRLPLSLAHLAPSGAPIALAPFLVVIETLRVAIRPLTLALRLRANITAGHVLIRMIRIAALNAQTALIFVLIVSLGIFYFFFETAIMFLQAYIFTLLPTLYADEHPTK